MGLLRLLLFAILISLLYLGIFAKRGLLDFRKMVAKNKEFSTKTELLLQQKRVLANQILTFGKDSREQERVVRERLGYIRPNEIVIEFD